MRLTPLGVWSHRLTIDEAYEAAKSDARLTHPNLACQCAAGAYVVAIRHLMLERGDVDGAIDAAFRMVADESEEVVSWLQDAVENKGPAYHPQAGFVKIAFTHAFRHLKLRSSYSDAIQETLLGGGDTDTNACIVGGLVGALSGINGVPDQMWRPTLECNTELGRPRPEWLSPQLAESKIHELAQ